MDWPRILMELLVQHVWGHCLVWHTLMYPRPLFGLAQTNVSEVDVWYSTSNPNFSLNWRKWRRGWTEKGNGEYIENVPKSLVLTSDKHCCLEFYCYYIMSIKIYINFYWNFKKCKHGLFNLFYLFSAVNPNKFECIILLGSTNLLQHAQKQICRNVYTYICRSTCKVRPLY